jgi:hypothetical protein
MYILVRQISMLYGNTHFGGFFIFQSLAPDLRRQVDARRTARENAKGENVAVSPYISFDHKLLQSVDYFH